MVTKLILLKYYTKPRYFFLKRIRSKKFRRPITTEIIRYILSSTKRSKYSFRDNYKDMLNIFSSQKIMYLRSPSIKTEIQIKSKNTNDLFEYV